MSTHTRAGPRYAGVMRRRTTAILSALLLVAVAGSHACAPSRRSAEGANAALLKDKPAEYLRRHYTKREYLIPMRDGVRLFTAVYTPRDAAADRAYPFLMRRTPYSCRPYGEDQYAEVPAPSREAIEEGFILVMQDVRGRFMSEGEFVDMTPHRAAKAGPRDTDESTDTYDTIEWLLANVPHHNGRVGLTGISYPGFYASAGMIDAHPALKAVSPQAPIADWFFDDFFHHGAFFLPHNVNFFAGFGKPRPLPTTEWNRGLDHGTPDGFQFFKDLGPLTNVNERHFKGEIAFWNEVIKHPNYDDFWQRRNILPHLKNVAPAVMVVGGLYDAEDLYGTFQTYYSIERQNPGVFNSLVVGPWIHGGWARTPGDRLGNITFGRKTSDDYRGPIELSFFNHFLKDKGPRPAAEATIFETGANRWRTFDAWPPKDRAEKTLHLRAGGGLTWDAPAGPQAYDEYISDPARPVPFTEEIAIGMTREYMTDDQRFAARRPDVLTYTSDVLAEDITLAGPMLAELLVSTSGTDSDWVVKVIDVHPMNAKDPPLPEGGRPRTRPMGNYHEMIRSEVFRGRFRNSYEKPEPFVPNQPTRVRIPLQDVLHTFRKGHRIQIQVQSTWFPLVDLNPQTFVPNIFEAKPADFAKATQRVHTGGERGTKILIGVIPAEPIPPAPAQLPAATRGR